MNTATTVKKKAIPLLVLAVVLFSTLVNLVNPLTSKAADTSKFKPGNIISDSVFTNKTSITAQGVQNFLNSKVPACDTNGIQPLDGGYSSAGVPDYNGNGVIQRWEWGKKKYNQTKFTCLRNYHDSSGKSAARIIYNHAQTYSINPKVLIVLLQKEQGLVTDTWPLNLQYRSATGYGCPDTAACNTQYYGFSNQVKWAATMFRAILNDSPSWYTPYELGNNAIPWHPNVSSCGYSTVNILNRSTQALYNYTPYRPNAAALSAGYGSGNSCSSYGNRNFWLYFTDWFGNTTTSYDAEVYDTTLYSDSGRTTPINLSSGYYNVTPGQTVYVTVDVKNVGPKTLTQSFFKVGTTSPRDRYSEFNDGTWLNGRRPVALNEPSIATNASGTFLFRMKVPRDIGQVTEKFGLVAESIRWISQDSIVLPFNITPASNYDVTHLSNVLYTNAAMTLKASAGMADEPILRPGQKLYGKLTFKNIGSQTLAAATTKIGTDSPRDNDNSNFYDSSWLSTRRLASPSVDINSGSTGAINYILAPSLTEGTFTESFGVVNEGLGWADIEKLTLSVTLDNDGPYIQSGEELQPGESLSSGIYSFAYQLDGNLVIYKNSQPLWHARTNGKPSTKLILQDDGNLVLYNNTTPVWHTRTNGRGFSKLIMQGDGNLVIYKADSKPAWVSRTKQ